MEINQKTKQEIVGQTIWTLLTVNEVARKIYNRNMFDCTETELEAIQPQIEKRVTEMINER